MFTEAANFNEKDSDLSTAYRFGKLVYQAINTTNSYGLSQNNSVTGGAPGEFLIFSKSQKVICHILFYSLTMSSP